MPTGALGSASAWATASIAPFFYHVVKAPLAIFDARPLLCIEVRFERAIYRVY